MTTSSKSRLRTDADVDEAVVVPVEFHQPLVFTEQFSTTNDKLLVTFILAQNRPLCHSSKQYACFCIFLRLVHMHQLVVIFSYWSHCAVAVGVFWWAVMWCGPITSFFAMAASIIVWLLVGLSSCLVTYVYVRCSSRCSPKPSAFQRVEGGFF